MKTKSGFTLIELILYIGLVSIFLRGAILFAWDIIYSGQKSAVEREVNQNLRLASKRIAYEIRNASSINSVSSNDLCLASSSTSYNPIRFYLSSGSLHLAWGGGSSNCTSMTNDVTLTSNTVSISTLTFSNRSSGSNSYNIEYTIGITSTAARKEWQKTGTYSGTSELRSH